MPRIRIKGSIEELGKIGQDGFEILHFISKQCDSTSSQDWLYVLNIEHISSD